MYNYIINTLNAHEICELIDIEFFMDIHLHTLFSTCFYFIL